MTQSERLEELNNQINMQLAQLKNQDVPYTKSEYRAMIHQIDRLTIKRDLLQDKVNLNNKKRYNKQLKEKENVKYIIIFYLLYLLLEFCIFICFLSWLK